MEIVESLSNNKTCIFCRHNAIDELSYGKMYKIEDIITHYFCMLFSANMEQNGTDEEGILGFLPNDIKKEKSRGDKLICNYCRHPGATIGCFVKTCKKKFHYPCGIEHGTLHLFYGQFRSYCDKHRKPQNVPPSAIKLTEKSICMMCQDEVVAKPMLPTLWAPCCKTTWLHRSCVQRMAINAGYLFKCPNCNNKEQFRKEMLRCGIYIPDQDAAWELEPNAFSELMERYSACDAENCVCPKGRNFTDQGSDWEVFLCRLCGSQGIHNECGKFLFDNKGQWTCPSCSAIEKNDTRVSSTMVDDAGPSELIQKQPQSHLPSQNLRKEPNTSDRSRRYNRRKRSLSPTSMNETECTPSKIRSDTFPSEHGDDTLCVFSNSGEQIEVVRLGSNQVPNEEIGGVQVDINVVQIDSDDEDIDKNDENQQSDTDIEKKLTNLGLSNGRRKINQDAVPSIIIDLLDDSSDDDEPNESRKRIDEPASTDDNLTKCLEDDNNNNDDDDDDDDDVIFVCCDPPIPSSSKDDTSTALLRIVRNDGILIATPTEIRKNSSLGENAPNRNTLVTTSTSTTNPAQAGFRLLSREHTNTDNNRNYVWQSIPLHKSNSNTYTYPPPQITSIRSLVNSQFHSYNNSDQQQSAVDNIISEKNSSFINEMQIPNILKENDEPNLWITETSEIINLD